MRITSPTTGRVPSSAFIQAVLAWLLQGKDISHSIHEKVQEELDDMVHDRMTQSCIVRLGDAGAVPDADLDEAEQAASKVNNQGMDGQLLWLFGTFSSQNDFIEHLAERFELPREALAA